MDEPAAQNSQTVRIGAAIVAVIAVGAGAWWYFHRAGVSAATTGDTPVDAALSPAPVVDASSPGVQHPLAPEPADTTAVEPPAPVDPDAAMQGALSGLFGEPTLAGLLIPDQLVRRLVATTDNLSRDARTESLRPLRAPAAPFAVQREVLDATVGTDRITLAPQNFARYDSSVAVLANTDMAQAAKLYRRLYPSLQKAYEDLGYPGRYFNDRVVAIIDHLLETPEPTEPLLLEQPKVLYRYADSSLESRSAGQKLLLRMGVEHERTVKQKLREFRAQIVTKE